MNDKNPQHYLRDALLGNVLAKFLSDHQILHWNNLKKVGSVKER